MTKHWTSRTKCPKCGVQYRFHYRDSERYLAHKPKKRRPHERWVGRGALAQRAVALAESMKAFSEPSVRVFNGPKGGVKGMVQGGRIESNRRKH